MPYVSLYDTGVYAFCLAFCTLQYPMMSFVHIFYTFCTCWIILSCIVKKSVTIVNLLDSCHFYSYWFCIYISNLWTESHYEFLCSFWCWLSCFFIAVLIWLLTAACIKAGRPQIAKKAIELAESRLLMDQWPEYYDGKLGRFIGKQARKNQTWSIAGYLVAKMMLEDPSHLGMISLEEDKQMKPQMKRSASWAF